MYQIKTYPIIKTNLENEASELYYTGIDDDKSDEFWINLALDFDREGIKGFYVKFKNEFTDLSFLKYFQKLKDISIEVNDADDFQLLALKNNCQRLHYSKIKNNIDFSVIKLFKNLNYFSCNVDKNPSYFEHVYDLSKNRTIPYSKKMPLDTYDFRRLKNFDFLELDNNIRGFDTSNIEILRKVKVFTAYNNKYIRALEKIKDWKDLEILQLEQVSQMAYLPSFKNLKSLKHLALCNCNNLINYKGIMDAPALEKIVVYQNKHLKIEDFAPLNNLETLKKVHFGNTKREINMGYEIFGEKYTDQGHSEVFNVAY